MRAARMLGVPRIVSPHGMLDRWAMARSALKKRTAAAVYERRHVLGARCAQALSTREVGDLKRFGFPGPIAVIPNGVHLPAGGHAASEWRQSLPVDANVLLYLGRIHPKKGLSELIEAWARLPGRARGAAERWWLVIAGWGERAYVDTLKETVAKGQIGRIRFVGPQFGGEKAGSFAAASAFVLPSHSEGLPLSALEAWAFGVPSILTAACNLSEGFAVGAAIETKPDPDAILEAVLQMVGMAPAGRARMGDAGCRLVRDRFSWAKVAERTFSMYRWVAGDSSRPEWIEN
jgi:poly(glycerol-phosphate) alpha-glucosyltransferase